MAVTVARHRIQQWPGPSNTGVPAGTSLTPSGTVTTSSAGQVISDLDITGNIVLQHNNVIIRRCRVTATTGDIGCIFPSAPRSGILVEDCELDGNDETGLVGIFDATGFTVRRCNIHGVGDGFDIVADFDARDNWIHDLSALGQDPHSDGVQLPENTANVTLAHNFIDAAFPVQGTSAIISAQPSNHSNIRIVGNRLWGGASTYYCAEAPLTGVYFNYNRLAYWTFSAVDGNTGDLTEFIGNVNDLTGAAI